jgi:hypothetical protein
MTMNRKEIILQEIEKNPQEPLNYYLLALEERRNKEWEACINLLKNLIEQFPTYHPSYYVLAEIFYQLDRIEEGTSIAERGIQQAKVLQLGKVLHELEQLMLLND